MSYSVRKFNREEDSEKLFILWKKVLKKPERGRLDAMYNDSTHGASSWMIYCNDYTDPVGCLSVLPVKIPNRRETATIGINCDMIITREHRTLGPAVMLARSLLKDAGALGYDVLLAMPNEMSMPVFKRVGYKKVGNAIRFSRVLRSRNKVSQIIRNEYVKLIVSYVVDMSLHFMTLNSFMRLYYWTRRKHIHEIDVSINDPDINSILFNEDIDNDTIDFLYWRYGQVGNNESRIFNIKDIKNNSNHYIVYYRQRNNAIIEHINSTEGIPGIFMLSRFIDRMYEERIETIQLLHWGPKKFHNILKYMGFTSRQCREILAFFINNEYANCVSELEDNQWFDGDLDL